MQIKSLLSGRTLHGVGPENWSCWKGLGFNLCVAPPHDRVVPNLGVTEFTEFTKIFRSTPEKTEKTERLEVCANGCTMVDIRTDPIIYDLFVYVSMGMNVSTKRKDNKTVMGHNKHNNQKWNITRSSEFRIGVKSENGEQ